MKVCSNGSGHTTNMAAISIYGKKHEKFFFCGTKRVMTLKVCMQHRVLEYYQVYSNDDPWLVYLVLFYGTVKFGPLCFCMGKS